MSVKTVSRQPTINIYINSFQIILKVHRYVLRVYYKIILYIRLGYEYVKDSEFWWEYRIMFYLKFGGKKRIGRYYSLSLSRKVIKANWIELI